MSWQYAIVAVAVIAAIVVLVRTLRSMMGSSCDSGHCGCGHKNAESDPFADRRVKATQVVPLSVNPPARSSGPDNPPC